MSATRPWKVAGGLLATGFTGARAHARLCARPLLRAQVASQQGNYLAGLFSTIRIPPAGATQHLPGVHPPFKYHHSGSFAYVGGDRAVLEVANDPGGLPGASQRRGQGSVRGQKECLSFCHHVGYQSATKARFLLPANELCKLRSVVGGVGEGAALPRVKAVAGQRVAIGSEALSGCVLARCQTRTWACSRASWPASPGRARRRSSRRAPPPASRTADAPPFAQTPSPVQPL
jgi:hypothetical protein